jgi:hypothetical protein
MNKTQFEKEAKNKDKEMSAAYLTTCTQRADVAAADKNMDNMRFSEKRNWFLITVGICTIPFCRKNNRQKRDYT